MSKKLNINNFSNDEVQHYSRHILLDQIGAQGQIHLRDTRVLCVGAGGLGSPLLYYLAASGVGTLSIVDHDCVEHSNLHRQLLFTENNIGEYKAQAAKTRLVEHNPHITIHAHPAQLTKNNASDLINQHDIIVDCTDNFATHYLINDTCIQANKPLVAASIDQFQGQCSVFVAGDGPCYRCLFPTPPQHCVMDCATAGVLGVLPGLLGMIQATEVIKLIIGFGETLSGRVLQIDTLTMTFKTQALNRDPQCPACQHRPAQQPTGALSQIENIEQLTPQQVQQRLQSDKTTTLLDVRQGQERAQAHIGGVFIPLAELPQRLHELDKTQAIVVYCHAGIRGNKAARLLQAAGFADVANLQGGILAWQRETQTST